MKPYHSKQLVDDSMEPLQPEKIGDTWSSKGNDDSNAILLSKKKKSKTKDKNQIEAKLVPQLRKSQKRKLKKLEEEKERRILELKSMKILERYKISDDVHSILRSSGNMGQVETRQEKRMRSIQLSKAGLQVPDDVQLSKKKGNQGASCRSKDNMELDSEKGDSNQQNQDDNSLKPIVCKRESVDAFALDACASSYDHPKPTCFGALGTDPGSNTMLCSQEVADNVTGNCMQGDQQNFSIVPCTNDRGICKKPQGRAGDESMKQCEKICIATDLTGQQHMKGTTLVHVSRPKEVDDKRGDLPIVMMEQEIMEAINDHSTVIICGETGCGKTTQVPQFLYEAGFGSSQYDDRKGIIGVTQPRRVAVLATAKRVAFELGLHLGKEVGFQVRHDKKIGENCSIKFMTDGILLREVQSDFLLKRYSVIILDEAHERSLNTDILIGMLSRVIQVRQKLFAEQQEKILLGVKISPENMITQLKLVLMSATLRVEDFTSGRRLFCEPPPVVEVPTRQFPVTVHFSKRTEIVDYMGQAYKKIMLIHKKLPPGGILVFVTGQREVENLCQRLRKASRQQTENNSKGQTGEVIVADSEVGTMDRGPDMKEISEAFDTHGDSPDHQNGRFSSCNEDLDDFGRESYTSGLGSESELSEESDNEGSLNDETAEKTDSVVDVLRESESIAALKTAFEALSGKAPNANHKEKPCFPAFADKDESSDQSQIPGRKHGIDHHCAGPLHVLPLYAMLPAAAQLRVFEERKG